MTTTIRTRQPFIDWMKAAGMALIVLGHVGGRFINHLTPPFYPKQLGVAFFLFVTGFSMACDRRPSVVVVPRRLFEVFVIGIGFAVLMSVVGVIQNGDLAESNYLPFLLGANVALNDFPANPTTWFVGTYTHALLLGALVLRRVSFRPWMLAATFIAEIVARATLMHAFGLFVAYMLLTNWATVFLMGFFAGQDPESVRPGFRDLWILPVVVLTIAWTSAWATIDLRPTFPFMMPVAGSDWVDIVIISSGVSCGYIAFTLMFFRAACRLPARPLVGFFARNTFFIFVAHMPLYFALRGPLENSVPGRLGRVTILFALCFVGLAIVSEFLRRIMQLDRMRNRLWPTQGAIERAI